MSHTATAAKVRAVLSAVVGTALIGIVVLLGFHWISVKSVGLGTDGDGDGVYDDLEPGIAELADGRDDLAGPLRAYFSAFGVALRSDGGLEQAELGAHGIVRAMECLIHRTSGDDYTHPEPMIERLAALQADALRVGERSAAWNRFSETIGDRMSKSIKLTELHLACLDPTVQAWSEAPPRV